MQQIHAFPRQTRDRTIVATALGPIPVPMPANLDTPPGPAPQPTRQCAR